VETVAPSITSAKPSWATSEDTARGVIRSSDDLLQGPPSPAVSFLSRQLHDWQRYEGLQVNALLFPGCSAKSSSRPSTFRYRPLGLVARRRLRGRPGHAPCWCCGRGLPFRTLQIYLTCCSPYLDTLVVRQMLLRTLLPDTFGISCNSAAPVYWRHDGGYLPGQPDLFHSSCGGRPRARKPKSRTFGNRVLPGRCSRDLQR
jgi:hypothetical protein